jgi:hypothetical protein
MNAPLSGTTYNDNVLNIRNNSVDGAAKCGNSAIKFSDSAGNEHGAVGITNTASGGCASSGIGLNNFLLEVSDLALTGHKMDFVLQNTNVPASSYSAYRYDGTNNVAIWNNSSGVETMRLDQQTGALLVHGTLTGSGGYYNNGVFLFGSSAPTIGGGGCTTGSAQSISKNNGSAAFEITLGGATCTSAILIALPAAANGWVCDAHDQTNGATNKVEQTSQSGNNGVNLTNFVRTTGVAGNFTGGDKIAVKCVAY